MQKIWYDTEFIEGFRDGKHFIDLISIGMVNEKDEEYYSYSKEFSYEDADEWVKTNIIKPIYDKADLAAIEYISVKNFNLYSGKSNKEIAEDIKKFVGEEPLILYGYYSSYDHVLLSSLFGRLLNLPKNFPMYTRDIMQMIEGENVDKEQLLKDVPQIDSHDALADAKWNKKAYEYIKEKLSKSRRKNA